MSQELILLAAIGLTILFALLAIAELVLGKNRKLQYRLKKMRQRMGDELPDVEVQASVLREDKTAAPTLDKMLKKMLPSAEVLSRRLARAGLEMGPGSFIAMSVFVAVMGAGALFFGAKLSLVVAIFGGIGIGVGGAHVVIDLFIARRNVSFTKSFPDAIDLIVRAVKSGLPVTEGISIVAGEMQGPVAFEFKRISEAMKIGETMEDALWKAAKRLENAEFNFFVISLVVQSETGGNLAETLENLSDILRQRQTMKLKVKAMASEARASAYILGGLPFAMFAILEVMSPGYTQPLYTSDTGTMLSIGALISIVIGALVMFKMVRFEI
ncbi:Flp pilus assembly protein TadB [Candidatus Terasakiella magnetica]|uniref:Flp pilus assembly protein TadB n=1 Tax=Candidatus Terasakiella magnetica TaxID=1867952 RepID=A0A1C3REP3_9PROT|nr:type II secretion system F family protein [Candidatus Terasakiella magnetica]SCA55712.1 Flp pilus assembly protein TadB [Candidatus Terasakiella magnetica]